MTFLLSSHCPRTILEFLLTSGQLDVIAMKEIFIKLEIHCLFLSTKMFSLVFVVRRGLKNYEKGREFGNGAFLDDLEKNQDLFNQRIT